jgi:hypothetical protein
MAGPAWLADIFAVVMITVAVYCASRLVVARWWRRPSELDTAGAHVVLGVAMAGMLAGGLRFLSPGTWEAVFAAGGAWFAWQVVRVRRGAPLSQWHCPQPVPHLVECGAMLYMFLALPAVRLGRGASAMSGMGRAAMSATESRFSLLPLVLALFMFGYVVWVADRLKARTPAVAIAVPASAVPVTSAVPVARGPDDSGARMTADEPMAGGREPCAGGPEPRAASHGGCAGAGAGLGYACLAPRCAALCKIAMGITMGYMLIMML